MPPSFSALERRERERNLEFRDIHLIVNNSAVSPNLTFLIRKEVIQPHLPVRLPCYDFTPLTRRTFGTVPLAVRLATSGTSDSDGVTGGVYKARERIHRIMLICDY